MAALPQKSHLARTGRVFWFVLFRVFSGSLLLSMRTRRSTKDTKQHETRDHWNLLEAKLPQYQKPFWLRGLVEGRLDKIYQLWGSPQFIDSTNNWRQSLSSLQQRLYQYRQSQEWSTTVAKAGATQFFNISFLWSWRYWWCLLRIYINAWIGISGWGDQDCAGEYQKLRQVCWWDACIDWWIKRALG